MKREELTELGVSEELADRIVAKCEVKDALRKAGVRSMKLALPLIDESGDVAAQIARLRAEEETAILFEPVPIRGVSPGESADQAAGLSAETFEARKNDPNWINRNWAQVADALEHGRIKH